MIPAVVEPRAEPSADDGPLGPASRSESPAARRVPFRVPRAPRAVAVLVLAAAALLGSAPEARAQTPQIALSYVPDKIFRQFPEEVGEVAVELRAQTDGAVPPVGDFAVYVDAKDGTAIVHKDFRAFAQTFADAYTFRAQNFVLEGGHYVHTVSKDLEIINDATTEKTERFTIEVDASALPAHVTAPRNGGVVTIELRDSDVTMVSITCGQAEEGEGILATISLDKPVAYPWNIIATQKQGEARASTDYGFLADVVLFAVGETEKTLIIQTTEDEVDEPDETFEFLAEAVGLNDGIQPQRITTPCTILDDDGAPEAPRDVRPAAGDGAVTVQWTSNGDGAAPLLRHEYRLRSQQDAWVAISDSGEGEANDGEYTIANLENGESAIVYLRAVNEDGAGRSSKAVTVVPQSGAPGAPTNFGAVRVSDREIRLSWTEPRAGPGIAILGYNIESSEDGVDWSGSSATVDAGTTVWTMPDLGPNRTEHYRIRTLFRRGDDESDALAHGVSPHSMVKAASTGLPVIRVGDAQGTEGVDDAVVFTVTLSRPVLVDETISVDFATVSGTAEAYSDYDPQRGTLRFDPGETEGTISVPIVNDPQEDSGEIFYLLLESPSGAIIEDGEAIGTILNTEGEVPSVSPDPLTGFTLVDASTDTEIGAVADGAAFTLPDPAAGSYGFVAQTAADAEVGSVRLALAGATSSSSVEGVAPYSLYGDDGTNAHGEGLPAGSYTLTATAYAEAQGGGAALQTLEASFTVDAEAPLPPAEPLTASFSGMPAEHDGESTFTFSLTFSEEPEDLSFRTLRDEAFDISGGAVRKAPRQQQGSNQAWTIHVEPSGRGAVSIVLPATTDCGASGAICTGDGRPLSNAPSGTVGGPAGLSVADARAEENTDPTIDFTVSLDRAAAGTVTVGYATVDGTATAGADYTAASGTLTFQAGARTQTVAVTLLDDTHDEGEETFTLALSNASGAAIADGEATGTIENSDPMPRALLARFGRAAAVHVVEHVEERLQAPREPGFRGRFAGRELRKGMEREIALGFLNQLGGSAGVNPAGGGTLGSLSGMSGLGGGAGLGMAAATGPLGGAGLGALGGGVGLGSMSAGAGPGGPLAGRGLLQMGLGGGDLLTGSAFALNRETGSGGILSFWSRGARSSFHGREGALALNGDVRTTMVGADYAKGRLVAGLSLARSQSLGGYSTETAGQVESAVTGLYPWVGYKVTDRVSVWGVTGYGAGALLLTPGAGAPLESGLSMAMTAGGARGDLIAGGAGGFELAFKADALWVGTGIEGVDGPTGRLAATEAAVTRFRTGLEGSRDFALGGVLLLKPLVEVGLRHDGGDAETGAGMDIGGGVMVSSPSSGLSVDVRLRMLVAHQAEGFRERGMSLSLSYNPTPSTPLGFAAKVAPSWGGQATGGAQALWGRETMAGLANGGFASGNRLDGEVGYGLPVGSRFVGTPRVGLTTSEYGRAYRLGYGMTLLERGALGFELGVDAQRRENPDAGAADNGVLGRATVRW